MEPGWLGVAQDVPRIVQDGSTIANNGSRVAEDEEALGLARGVMAMASRLARQMALARGGRQRWCAW